MAVPATVPARRLEALLPELRRIACVTTKDAGATRRFYSYPAKFLAHLPRRLVELLTAPGDLVLDPYAGGGTTGLEAMLLGRRFVGYDLSPFAHLVARVKTTRIEPARLARARDAALQGRARPKPLFDADERALLGERAAGALEALAGRVDALGERPERDALRLALVHAIKLQGRRDRAEADPVATFAAKSARMVAEMGELPPAPFAPRFVLASNHAMDVADGAARLVVTSPPYKDLDVEYMQVQIQRPAMRRSKRSDVIARVLDVQPVPKRDLCGGRGASYWERLAPSLAQTRRCLAPGAPAFWWIGFKTDEDRARFERMLEEHAFELVESVPARLSDNRAASSRSTHHGRPTGMMQRDFLHVTRAA